MMVTFAQTLGLQTLQQNSSTSLGWRGTTEAEMLFYWIFALIF